MKRYSKRRHSPIKVISDPQKLEWLRSEIAKCKARCSVPRPRPCRIWRDQTLISLNG